MFLLANYWTLANSKSSWMEMSQIMTWRKIYAALWSTERAFCKLHLLIDFWSDASRVNDMHEGWKILFSGSSVQREAGNGLWLPITGRLIRPQRDIWSQQWIYFWIGQANCLSGSSRRKTKKILGARDNYHSGRGQIEKLLTQKFPLAAHSRGEHAHGVHGVHMGVVTSLTPTYQSQYHQWRNQRHQI